MIRDPALRFWVEYAEAEGALCEAEAETAELILPAALQRAFGLPETLTVTSDPDIAEEDGAVLLTIGHSALDAAAARVLARGDVGRAFLPWPPHASRTSRETLLANARAAIGIDHGRIDAERDPMPVYYPLLRVGALITYTLDDRFQECEEIWVDGCTGHALSRGIVMPRGRRPLRTDARPVLRSCRPTFTVRSARRMWRSTNAPLVERRRSNARRTSDCATNSSAPKAITMKFSRARASARGGAAGAASAARSTGGGNGTRTAPAAARKSRRNSSRRGRSRHIA